MFIRLSKIKITKEFKKHKPKKQKIAEKDSYFILNNTFKEKIILDKNNVLLDGYTTYLLAKEYKKKIIWAHKRRQSAVKKYIRRLERSR